VGGGVVTHGWQVGEEGFMRRTQDGQRRFGRWNLGEQLVWGGDKKQLKENNEDATLVGAEARGLGLWDRKKS